MSPLQVAVLVLTCVSLTVGLVILLLKLGYRQGTQDSDSASVKEWKADTLKRLEALSEADGAISKIVQQTVSDLRVLTNTVSTLADRVERTEHRLDAAG